MGKDLRLGEGLAIRWTAASGRYTIVLSDACRERMIRLARNHDPNEVGTSLIGRYSEDGFTAFVEDIAPLAPDSKGARYSFHRGVSGLKEFFHKLLSEPEPQKYYVGEWHSHPKGAPVPSHRDDESQAAIAADPATNCPEVILIIVGGNLKQNPTVGVFVYSRQNGRIDLLPSGR